MAVNKVQIPQCATAASDSAQEEELLFADHDEPTMTSRRHRLWLFAGSLALLVVGGVMFAGAPSTSRQEVGGVLALYTENFDTLVGCCADSQGKDVDLGEVHLGAMTINGCSEQCVSMAQCIAFQSYVESGTTKCAVFEANSGVATGNIAISGGAACNCYLRKFPQPPAIVPAVVPAEVPAEVPAVVSVVVPDVLTSYADNFKPLYGCCADSQGKDVDLGEAYLGKMTVNGCADQCASRAHCTAFQSFAASGTTQCAIFEAYSGVATGNIAIANTGALCNCYLRKSPQSQSEFLSLPAVVLPGGLATTRK